MTKNKYHISLFSNLFSLMEGLTPPDDEAIKVLCPSCLKVATPSQLEVRLAAKVHRWPAIRKIMKDFFDDVGTEIVNAEIDILKLLELPALEQIEDSFAFDFVEPGWPALELNAEKKKAYQRIISELQQGLIGETKLVKQIGVDELPLLDYFLLSSYGTGLNAIMEDIINNLPEGANVAAVRNTLLAPQLSNGYLQKIISDATKRIMTFLGRYYANDVWLALREMVEQGKSPWQIGRFLHKSIGKGRLWYWLRIVRSEIVLAIDAAFDAQARAANCLYEVWSASATACPICAAFDGRLWKIGDGPHPVEDTHPHCLCHRSGRYTIGDRQVQAPWRRESPYDQPYSDEELATLPGFLRDII